MRRLLRVDDFQVNIFIRNAPTINHKKLKIHVIDFKELGKNKDLIKGDIFLL